METNCFPSKKDTWLVATFIGSTLVCLFGSTVLLTAGASGLLMALPMTLVGIALPLWLLAATDYRFDGKTLVVRGGPFRWRIRVDQIYTVRPTHNRLSSPALSLDRLRLEYGDGKALMISPHDVEQFMCELQARGGPPLGAAG